MSLFEKFKRDKSSFDTPVSHKKAEEIFFILNFDSSGSFIKIVNKKKQEVEVDYRAFSGVLRSITKAIQLIEERNSFTIDWENPENKLYLHEHPYLIQQLIESGVLLNENGEKIENTPVIAVVNVELSKDSEDLISSQIKITFQNETAGQFRFINEDYAYLTDKNALIEVEPIGQYFNDLPVFTVSKMPIKDLQKFLSLFYSYFENTNLKYENYKIIKKTESIKARPALIFEKVSSDHSLYLRIGQMMPNAEINFLDDYDLLRFVTINDLEESLNVHPIEQLHLEAYIDQIEKTLSSYLPKGKQKNSVSIVREGNLLIIPEKVASEFIYKEIPKLIADFALVGSEKLKNFKVNIHKPKLNIQLGHGIDFLEGDASLDFGEQNISLFDALNQFNKNRYILLADGSHALVNEQYMQKLQRLFKKKKDKSGNVQVSFFDLPLMEELIEEKTGQEQFKKSRAVYEGFNLLAKKKVKLPKVNAELRPYQKQGYKWLKYLYENKLGGCLADDMGLGKTLQTITLLAEVYAGKKELNPSILAMPKSLIFNWEKELARFAPQLTYYTWYGQNRDIKEAKKHQLILTTYALLRNDIEIWKEEAFLYAILDESQAAKNTSSQVHKAALLLNASHRLALSGTPVENNLSELYALFRFLNPTMFGSMESFNQNYLSPIQKHGDQDAVLELKKKIYPFILRRLKKDVLKDLPEKIEQTLYVEMSPAQARLYEQRRLFYKNAIEQQVAMKGIQQTQFFIFQAMNELRQIASVPESQTEGKISSPKLETLVDNLEEAIINRHKILVFCNYLAAVELVGEELNKRDIDFVTMTGSTKNRQELVEKFQNDDECKVFILTLKTGGTGLNLTAADMVFIFDPWWNKAAENQAIDRTHRIGQDKTVMSYKFITLGTIEEKILKLQEMKSALFEDIISTDSASLKSLSEDDIQFILG